MLSSKLIRKILKSLQNYAHWCAENNTDPDSIIYPQSTQKFSSFNDKNEAIELTSEEIIKLRDNFLKINQKPIIIDLNWLHRFTQKYKLSYRKLNHYSPKSFQEVEDFILEFLHEVHRIRATENIIPDMRQVIKPLVLWQRTKEEFKDQKALLIVDNFSGYDLDSKEKEEFEKLGIIIKHLKPYTTAYCQPRDLNVNYLI